MTTISASSAFAATCSEAKKGACTGVAFCAAVMMKRFEASGRKKRVFLGDGGFVAS